MNYSIDSSTNSVFRTHSSSLFPPVINGSLLRELNSSKRFSEGLLNVKKSFRRVAVKATNRRPSLQGFTLIGTSLKGRHSCSESSEEVLVSKPDRPSSPKQRKCSFIDPRIQYLKAISLSQQLIEYSIYPIVLGHGTYSHVYKGRLLSKDVAIKRFNKFSEANINRRNFLHEGLMTLQLCHRNIIQLMGVIYREKDSFFALVFEYMNIGSLESYILDESSSVSLAFTLQVSEEVGSALLHLHSRKIAHLDVKSSNILLSNAGGRMVTKLADFGFAQKIMPESQSKIYSIRGTPSWMAPEILVQRKRQFMHPSADVYSFGILLWQLFERKEPYKDLSIGEVYELKAKNHHPATTYRTPDIFLGILKLCWTMNPLSRPSMSLILENIAKESA